MRTPAPTKSAQSSRRNALTRAYAKRVGGGLQPLTLTPHDQPGSNSPPRNRENTGRTSIRHPHGRLLRRARLLTADPTKSAISKRHHSPTKTTLDQREHSVAEKDVGIHTPLRHPNNRAASSGKERHIPAASGTERQIVSDGGLELTSPNRHLAAIGGRKRQTKATGDPPRRYLPLPAAPCRWLPLADH